MPREDPIERLVRRRDTTNELIALLALSPTPEEEAKLKEKAKAKENGGNVAKAVAVSALDLTFMLSLVLGGCCS